MYSDTACTRDCAVNNACSSVRVSRSEAAFSSATVASSRFSSALVLVNPVNKASGSAEPLVCALVDRPGRRCPGAGQIAQVRRLGLLRALQRGVCLLDAGLDVGDQRRQSGDSVPDVGGGAVDSVEQRACLSQRRFRRVHRVDETALFAADRSGGQAARLAEVLFCEGQPILGGRDVGGHRSQCGRVELVVQLGHALFSRFDARGQVDDLLSQGVQARRCVDHQIAHLLESLPLRLQLDIGACRGNDDLGQQLAPLLPGLRYRVVELLTHGECLGQSRFGIVHGTGERLGTLFAELFNGQRQLVGAGAYRVVDVDNLPSR